MYKCHLCNFDFKKKQSLQLHLNDKRCKSELLSNLCKLNDLIEELKIKNTNSCDNNVNSIIGGEKNTYINVKIEINPINKLDLEHIEPEKMKDLLIKYDNLKEIETNTGYGLAKFPSPKILLSEYIKDVICDSEHPENQAVKYIKKKPPTYNSLIEDADGNPVQVIKNLKDTCELLTDPILNTLKKKLKECLISYRKQEKNCKDNEQPEFEYDSYDTAIEQLRKELNKENIKKALSSVLQNDILNNIQMKLIIERN